MQKYSVGIDISRSSFHVCISVLQEDQHIKVIASTRFSNEEAGFKLLVAWVEKHYKQKELPLVIVMEATGVYYERCALYLHRAGYYVSVILPNVAKKYLQSIGQKSKNDKIDARGLARMGAERKHQKWEPLDDFFYTLRSYTRQNEDLQQTRTVVNNQLHALGYQSHGNELVKSQLEEVISLIDQQIKIISKAIETHIESDADVNAKVEGILKIKGIGVLTVAVIIAETNGFALFKNIPQLVSYAGYDVVENQSGKHEGKTKISKKGNAHIRRALHMPALKAGHCEGSVFYNLRKRIVERTKIKMKGNVAVQKKLLVMIYTLWKTNQAFSETYLQKNDLQTEEQEQAPPFRVSPGRAVMAMQPLKKVAPGRPKLHKVNKPIEQSQSAPSRVLQS